MGTRVSEDMAREAAEEEERRKEVRLAGANNKDIEKHKEEEGGMFDNQTFIGWQKKNKDVEKTRKRGENVSSG